LRSPPDCGVQGLTDRSRRSYRYANQLPFQVENYILNVKREHSSWGARKIRERLIRRFSGIPIPAKSTIHAVLDRHGLVERRGRVRRRVQGTPLYLWDSNPTSCGAPITKVSSCLAIVSTVIRSPSPTTPAVFCLSVRRFLPPERITLSLYLSGFFKSVVCLPTSAATTACLSLLHTPYSTSASWRSGGCASASASCASVVVGDYSGADEFVHGFTWTEADGSTTFDFQNNMTGLRAINQRGDISGFTSTGWPCTDFSGRKTGPKSQSIPPIPSGPILRSSTAAGRSPAPTRMPTPTATATSPYAATREINEENAFRRIPRTLD